MSASMKTPLAKVRGTGSAKTGTIPFISQRSTAALLAPLLVWFALAVIFGSNGDYETSRKFLLNPINGGGVLALITVAVLHLRYGLYEIIHDYLHRPITRYTLLLLINFGSLLGVLVSIAALAKIYAGA